MVKNKKSAGFTIIELLMSIAIVGILASIILVAVNSSRTKGKESSIVSNISNIRAEAALYFTDYNGSYGSSNNLNLANCTSNGNTASTGLAVFYHPDIERFITAAAELSGGQIVNPGTATATVTRTTCRKYNQTWAIAVTNASGNGAVCVDHTNKVKKYTGAIANLDSPVEAITYASGVARCT